MDFGQYDGLPIETPEFQKVRVEFSLPLPDGESIMDVAGRCILCWQSWNKVTKMFCWCVTMP